MKITIKSKLPELREEIAAVSVMDLPPVKTAKPVKPANLMSALVGAKEEIRDGDREVAESYVDTAINFAQRVQASPALTAALAQTNGTPLVKQSTRMLKYVCPQTGYTVRLSAKWAAAGAPICPLNHKPMVAA